MSEPIKVDIWSDVACPWCFIGKRKFERAVAEFPGEVEVEYHSYQLSPETPVEFEGSHEDYLAGRGFPREQLDGMIARVSGIAAGVGLDYDYEALQTTNTAKAHELIHYAKAHGRQAEMKERLMRAYFLEGRHVGRIPELAELAAEVGLDAADVTRALEAGEWALAVQADIATAGEYGIRGVPFFVLDDRYGISGAQETGTFLDALNAVAAERAS